MLAAGDQQRRQRQLVNQRLTTRLDLRLIPADTGHQLELLLIGLDQRGATVAAEVPPFGIHEHRHAGTAGGFDHAFHLTQRTLGVIGQHQQIVVGHLLGHLRCQRLGRLGRCRLLEVHADQLLVVTEDPQLADGAAVGMHPGALHPLLAHQPLKRFSLPVMADHAHERDLSAQRRDIGGHIGRTTGTGLFIGHIDHRNGRLRRDAPGPTLPVAVQHHIPDNEHPCRGKA